MLGAASFSHPRTLISRPLMPLTLYVAIRMELFTNTRVPFALAALLFFCFGRNTLGKPTLAGERHDVSTAGS